MKNLTPTFIFSVFTLVTTFGSAFVPSIRNDFGSISTVSPMKTSLFAQESETDSQNIESKADPIPEKSEKIKPVKKKKESKEKDEKDGIFTPVVLLTKYILGQDKFLKIRGQGVSLHSKVIKNFVDTSSSDFGKNVLERLFAIMDKDGNGTLDEEEMTAAFEVLGFSWLEEKQVRRILDKADRDDNGVIDFDEFVTGAPKTLKANLVKLAKKNGEDLGFLS